MSALDPISCGAFLLLAFVLSGTAQTAWFASAASRSFSQPLDAGLSLRGRRLFGANKTLRGFVVMVPATAAAFAALAALAGDPPALGLWNLSVREYARAGAVAGFGFMAGELPNSFLKRQLGIAPGRAPANPLAAVCTFVLDRLDSGIGMLAALALVVPVTWGTAGVVLLAGSVVHWTFSVVMFRLGLKARPA